jgi:hypothetical protein
MPRAHNANSTVAEPMANEMICHMLGIAFSSLLTICASTLSLAA